MYCRGHHLQYQQAKIIPSSAQGRPTTCGGPTHPGISRKGDEMINVAKDDAGCHVDFFDLRGIKGELPYTTIKFNNNDNADHNCRRQQFTTIMMINKDNVKKGKLWRW